jgi:hypothetical protein
MRKINTLLLITIIASIVLPIAESATNVNKNEDTYTISYHVLPDKDFGYPTDTYTPETQSNIKPKTYIELKDIPTSTQTYGTNKTTGETINGKWIFSTRWHADSISGLETIAYHNISRSHNMYGQWLFRPPVTYQINYQIIPDPVYGIPSDIAIPSSRKNILHGDTIFLQNVPATNINYAFDNNGNKITGILVRKSNVWYKNENLTQIAYYFENIRSDKTAYSAWRFYPDGTTFQITYNVIPNERYGTPQEHHIPKPDTNIPYNTNPKLIVPVTEFLSNDLYATDKLTGKKIKGVWQISPFWHDGSIDGEKITMYWGINQNHEVYAKWYFFPI